MIKKIMLSTAILANLTAFAAARPGLHSMNISSGERSVADRFKVEKNGNVSSERGDSEIRETTRAIESVNQPIRLRNDFQGYNGYRNSGTSILRNTLASLLNTSYTYLGVPYLWGGTTKSGIDCSAFVQKSYSGIGVNLPRVSRDQAKVGKPVSLVSVREGDLLFFETDSKRPGVISHVGMYVGKGRIIHASSSSKKVIIADLNTGYFLNKMRAVKRVIDI